MIETLFVKTLSCIDLVILSFPLSIIAISTLETYMLCHSKVRKLDNTICINKQIGSFDVPICNISVKLHISDAELHLSPPRLRCSCRLKIQYILKTILFWFKFGPQALSTTTKKYSRVYKFHSSII